MATHSAGTAKTHFADMFASGVAHSAVRAAGATVSDFRKAKKTPREIRDAGFTLAEMQVHLGAHLLREAGFTAAELRADGHCSASELLGSGFTAQQALAGGYSMSELCVALPSSGALASHGLSLTDVVAGGGAGYWQLRAMGFSARDLEGVGMSLPAPVAPPPSLDASLEPDPTAIPWFAMPVGDRKVLKATGPSGMTLDVTMTRVSPPVAAEMLASSDAKWLQQDSYSYEGAGMRCPACGQVFMLVSHYASSDGMAGDESGKFICCNPGCGIVMEERYRGYGTMFFSWKEL